MRRVEITHIGKDMEKDKRVDSVDKNKIRTDIMKSTMEVTKNITNYSCL